MLRSVRPLAIPEGKHMAEPTGRLTFGDLLLEAALEMGVAYFGADGTEAAQVPLDAHDLAEVKRHTNNAIRMLIGQGPPGDWQWRRPVISLVLWASLEETTGVTVTGGVYDAGNDQTTITANTSVFYPSMELHDLVIDGVGTFEIASYTSATVVVVTGDASTASADLYSITADGNYTLPQTFTGQYTGKINYAAETNQSYDIQWGDEGTIRSLREDTLDTNFPTLAAVRVMTGGRRWELLTYQVPSTVTTVEFPSMIYFTTLTDEADLPSMPYTFDEALKAATLFVVERDVHKERNGPHFEYYTSIALPAAWTLDQRSAPRKIGYFGNPATAARTPWNFRDFRSRPTVNTDNI